MKKVLLSSFLALGIFANAQCEPIATFPATWNFENVTSPALPDCWTIATSGDGLDWNTYTSTGIFGTTSGTKYLNNALVANKIGSSWIFTRPFALTAGHTYTVKFLSLATTNTNSRILKVAYGATASSAGMTTTIGTDDTLTNTHENKSYTFTASATGTYYIGFNGYNTVADAVQTSILIDDIAVNDETLAVSDVNSKSKIAVYPNPVKDILKISDIKGVKSISVIDMSGRQIKTLAPSNEIDLSSLKTGNYVVSLIMENGNVQSINTIKK